MTSATETASVGWAQPQRGVATASAEANRSEVVATASAEANRSELVATASAEANRSELVATASAGAQPQRGCRYGVAS
jgi:hypothetical protein